MIELNDSHEYFVDNQRVPGFSEIAKATGLIRPYTGDPWYGERGTACHSASVLIDQGVLDWDSVDPRIQGFLDAYVKFKEETGTEWEHSETKLFHPTYRYCGTLDRFLPLYDLKTGAGDMTQIESYAELLRANGYDPGRVGYMLKLNENGTYHLEPHRYDRKLLGVFLSAVSVWWYRKERGLL
jgi:hypothetical protein